MSKKQNNNSSRRKHVPRVRLARPRNRPIQLRYYCPVEQREIRVSTGTRDEQEADLQKRELEAKLLLGIPAQRPLKRQCGPQMPWPEFREAYRNLQLSTISEGSAIHAESRLDVTERILSPRVLADVASAEALHKLQADLLRGAESAFKRPRSPHTVKSYVTSVMAAINWAYLQGWVETPPKIRKIKVGKLKKMKGRPLSQDEFSKMVDCVSGVVGEKASDSWNYVLRGLWESALRLEELMHLSWDDPTMIRPQWQAGKLPVLEVPQSRQKNATEEDIPLLPGFEELLLETPIQDRHGYVFNPMSLQTKLGRHSSGERLTAEWVGKVVSRIGETAGIVVSPSDDRTGRPAKYASAHDLRRSCAQRMLDAGVPPLLVARILRHASWDTTRKHYAPGNTQSDAKVIRAALAG